MNRIQSSQPETPSTPEPKICTAPTQAEVVEAIKAEIAMSTKAEQMPGLALATELLAFKFASGEYDGRSDQLFAKLDTALAQFRTPKRKMKGKLASVERMTSRHRPDRTG